MLEPGFKKTRLAGWMTPTAGPVTRLVPDAIADARSTPHSFPRTLTSSQSTHPSHPTHPSIHHIGWLLLSALLWSSYLAQIYLNLSQLPPLLIIISFAHLLFTPSLPSPSSRSSSISSIAASCFTLIPIRRPVSALAPPAAAAAIRLHDKGGASHQFHKCH
uniref:Uncharacterized protein n=1 Tax=Bionectria ochroleuca TaxID=29856 RepID=A0A8H7NJY9_BIOOC